MACQPATAWDKRQGIACVWESSDESTCRLRCRTVIRSTCFLSFTYMYIIYIHNLIYIYIIHIYIYIHTYIDIPRCCQLTSWFMLFWQFPSIMLSCHRGSSTFAVESRRRHSLGVGPCFFGLLINIAIYGICLDIIP